MRRLAVLALVMGLVLAVTGSVANAGYIQVASPSPSSGPPGTAVTVIISWFTGNIDIEVHEDDEFGALLGTGATDGSGIAGIPITIPGGAPVGPYTLYVCGVGSLIPCGDEFSERAVTIFEVTPPPTTTTSTVTIPTSTPTVTVAPLTTIPAVPVGSGPCDIPPGADVIDFDAWDRSMGTTEELWGELQTAILDAGHSVYARQWERYVFSVYPPTDDSPSYLPLPRVNSTGFIADNPARDLYTTSPPKVMRLIDDTVWSLVPYLYAIPIPQWGQLDYFGFNVGFGHFGEGFETPDELVVELRVALMPMEMPDGTVLDQGAWDTVSITLGPGPQPVTQCLMAFNTLGPTDPYSVHLIDILPRTVGGVPVHIPVDIDDVFYGVNDPVIPPLVFDELPVPGTVAPPIITTPVTLPFIEQPIEPFDLSPAPSDLPWRIAIGLAGLFVGVGAMWAFRRD